MVRLKSQVGGQVVQVIILGEKRAKNGLFEGFPQIRVGIKKKPHNSVREVRGDKINKKICNMKE